MSAPTTLLVPLTDEQRQQLAPLLAGLEDCGAVLAQVYPDAMRVALLSPATTRAVLLAIGAVPTDDLPELHRTATEAHAAAQARRQGSH